MVRKNLIGQKIKLARHNNNPKMTQEGLATRLELLGYQINRAVISKIETGDREINDIEIMAFAKALNVSVEWLFENLV
jgi:transcriptional regulator with XRE-family HTH domain